jgi:uncharacterized membrane-anchored protein
MIRILEQHFEPTMGGSKNCKVPQVTFWFWIAKCCATTVGETVSDFFNLQFDPCQCTQKGLGFDALLFVPLLLVTLYLQLQATKYRPTFYWAAIILCSIVGTIITDGFSDNWGLMVWIEVIIFFVLMIVCFCFWYESEKTLDIHSINTTRREVYYWGTVIWTFALGTAVGDCTANHWQIGFAPILGFFVAIVFVLFVIWALGRFVFGYIKKNDNNEVFLFWLCYIMTRPLGASTGDLLGSSKNQGGWGFGVGWTSLLFFGIIIMIVCYLEYTGADQIQHSNDHQKVSDGSRSGDAENEIAQVVPKDYPHEQAEVQLV